MVSKDDRTMMHMDKKTGSRLSKLAEIDNRTKIDELRFLIEERAKELGVKLK